MKIFPDKIKPQNRNKFIEYKFNRELCKLRQSIVEYLYTEEENKIKKENYKLGGFDLKEVNTNSLYNCKHIDIKLVQKIQD